MFKFLSPKSIDNRYSYIETFMFMSVFVALGYLFQPSDPLLLESNILVLTAILSVITLFYGIENGFFALLFSMLILYSYYGDFHSEFLLQELVFILILGRFHTVWNYRLKLNQSQKEIFESKFRELGSSFYALKISHDQLERNYILRPISLRRMLLNILHDYQTDTMAYESFLNLISRTFNITKMSIVTVKNGVCTFETSLSHDHGPSYKTPLIQKVLESRTSAYIPSHVQEECQYVAVIPALKEGEVMSLLLIEEIPFMNFTEDNMISITFLLQYFYTSLHKKYFLENNHKLSCFDDDFRFEFTRLIHLYETFTIDSSIIAFKTSSKLVAHSLNEIIEKQQRGLDAFSSTEVSPGTFITLVMTPFSIASSAEVLQRRILAELEIGREKEIHSSIFSLKDEEILEEYIGPCHAQ